MWHYHQLEGCDGAVTKRAMGLLVFSVVGIPTDNGMFPLHILTQIPTFSVAARLPHVHDQAEASCSAGLAQSVRTNSSNFRDFAWKALDVCFGVTQVEK